MKTTLNFPNELISLAKIMAVHENTTLTNLLVQGLELRLAKKKPVSDLPVSAAHDGLLAGVSWDDLNGVGSDDEVYR